MQFDTISLDALDAMSDAALDALTFGVIRIGPDGCVSGYNATESRLAGLSPERVLGKQFFTAVAPCMNNFMVAQRFVDEVELDATLDYVLTLRMKPTPVKLRLLQAAHEGQRYVLVQR